MTVAQAPVSPLRAWGTVVVLFLLSTVAWMDRSVISMVISPLRVHFGISDVQVSLVAGLAFSVFYIVFLIPIGWLADRASRRLILFLGVVAWSLATIGFGLAASFGLLLAARMAVGAGEGTVSPVAAGTISRLFGRAGMAAPMSVYSLGASAGTALGVVCAGQILTVGRRLGHFHLPGLGALEPWQAVYVTLGVPGLLMAFLAFAICDPKGERETAVISPASQSVGVEARGGAWNFIARYPAAVGYTVFGFVAVNIAVTSVFTWAPEYLHRHFHLSPADIGWVIASTSLAAPLVCQLGSGWVVNRMLARGTADAPLRLMRWLLLAALPFGVGLWWAPTPLVFGVSLFFLMALIFASNPLGITAVQLIAPPHLRSSLAAIHLAVLGVVGLGLGSSVVAVLSQDVLPDHSLGSALALAVTVALLLAAGLLRLGEPSVRRLLQDQETRLAPARPGL